MFRIAFFVVFASMFVPNWCFGVDYMNYNLNSSLIQPLCEAFCYSKPRILQPLQESLSKYLYFCRYCQKPGTKPTTVTPSSMGTKPTEPASSIGTKKPISETPSGMGTKPTAPASSAGTEKPTSETTSAGTEKPASETTSAGTKKPASETPSAETTKPPKPEAEEEEETA